MTAVCFSCCLSFAFASCATTYVWTNLWRSRERTWLGMTVVQRGFERKPALLGVSHHMPAARYYAYSRFRTPTQHDLFSVPTFPTAFKYKKKGGNIFPHKTCRQNHSFFVRSILHSGRQFTPSGTWSTHHRGTTGEKSIQLSSFPPAVLRCLLAVNVHREHGSAVPSFSLCQFLNYFLNYAQRVYVYIYI